eukprot:gb/GFBE01003716.1/.p1 GENE.gb/GFBE01003716.1/~~gb/GFBE01003716.1/.p1  ORF type:complete len:194 (+),score=23.31 gb/GFBE01003716.1/:1-582(+)
MEDASTWAMCAITAVLIVAGSILLLPLCSCGRQPPKPVLKRVPKPAKRSGTPITEALARGDSVEVRRLLSERVPKSSNSGPDAVGSVTPQTTTVSTSEDCIICSGRCSADTRFTILKEAYPAHCACLVRYWNNQVRAMNRLEQVPYPGDIAGYFSAEELDCVSEGDRRRAQEDIQKKVSEEDKALEDIIRYGI